MRISEFIEESNEIDSLSDLFALLVQAARCSGFEQIAYGALTSHNHLRAADHPAPAILLNYPAEWQSHYFQRSYQRIDPVVIHTPTLATPYLWDQFPTILALDQRQQLVLDEAREAGLKNGVSVPLHGPWGDVAVVSFASHDGKLDPQPQLGRLHALAAQFHTVFSDVKRPGQRQAPSLLSSREAECLAWAAQGKSSWDTSMILAISENTVNFHIKNAMKKLETNNRTVAVVKAIRLGVIRP